MSLNETSLKLIILYFIFLCHSRWDYIMLLLHYVRHKENITKQAAYMNLKELAMTLYSTQYGLK